ncbi:MAG: MFS transporter [Nitrospirota bacterium]|nr:MFS transporter [Nitrospirota bacterium]
MTERKKPFPALYVQNFRLFWIAQVISLSGSWMHQMAQGWLIYQLTRSPLYLGIAGAALTLPVLMFTLFGGIIADRYSKRNILIVTQTLSIFPPLILGTLTYTGTINVWHAILTAFLMGTINAFDIPARQSFLIEMVGKGHLLNAIALSSAAFNGARILGPLIAGLIISWAGLPACFYINALSFIPVVFVLKMMAIKGTARTGSSKGFFSEFKEGIHFILKQQDILTLILTIMVFSLFGIPFSQFFPVFAEDILGVGAKGLGYMMSSAGAGAFTAAMVIAFRGKIRNTRRYMSIAALIFPAALVAFSLSRSYPLSIIILVTMGWAAVSFLATANSSIQENVRDGLRGRVMSVYSLVFLGMAPIGSAVIGYTADKIGTPQALTAAGTICLIAGSVFFLRTRRGRIDY